MSKDSVQKNVRRAVEISDIPNLKMDPLRYCLNNNMIDLDGLWLEFGVHRGKTLDLISRYTKNDVYGFDTFSGLDAPWPGTPSGNMLAFDVGGSPPSFVYPLDPYLRGCSSKKKKRFSKNVNFVTGRFEETLEGFLESQNQKISFIHMDCDIYQSTKTVFDTCANSIKHGCIIVFDELVNYKNYHNHEIKAFEEFVLENNITFEWIGSASEILSDDDIKELYIEMREDSRQQPLPGRSVACRIYSAELSA